MLTQWHSDDLLLNWGSVNKHWHLMWDDTHLEGASETLSSSNDLWPDMAQLFALHPNQIQHSDSIFCWLFGFYLCIYSPKQRAHWTKTPLLMYSKPQTQMILVRVIVEVYKNYIELILLNPVLTEDNFYTIIQHEFQEMLGRFLNLNQLKTKRLSNHMSQYFIHNGT